MDLPHDADWKKTGRALGAAVVAAVALFVGVFFYQAFFSSTGTPGFAETFAVENGASFETVESELVARGYVASVWEFRLAFALVGGTRVAPGGYALTRGMNVFGVANTLKEPPPYLWVAIPEGFRKEQIADVLQESLAWTAAQAKEWLVKDTATPFEDAEGVYFPDTYLLPRAAGPAEVTERLRARFNEVFAPYAKAALAKNEKWTTIVTLASLIEREAAKNDMPLVAGILWNRLAAGMPLQVDATLQYAAATTSPWWAPATAAEKKIDSPYNTYLHRGLPPHPIANPGLAAIQAALLPAQTDCLYYLHDKNGVIHCSATYREHLAFIRKYLK